MLNSEIIFSLLMLLYISSAGESRVINKPLWVVRTIDNTEVMEVSYNADNMSFAKPFSLRDDWVVKAMTFVEEKEVLHVTWNDGESLDMCDRFP